MASIKKQESGISTSEICRDLGISNQTFYNWKAKYGGMEISEVKRTKELEAQLSQFKRMYADVSFQLEAAKALIAKKL